MFNFSYCCNKSTQTLWLRAAQVHFISLLKSETQKWVLVAVFFLEALGSSLTLSTSSITPCSSVYGSKSHSIFSLCFHNHIALSPNLTLLPLS